MTESSRLNINETSIEGVVEVSRQTMTDSRGSFSRLFCQETIASAGWIWTISQINMSLTKKAGTVRGLHYQEPPHTDAKVVICLRGAIWDVAVDLRKDSPTIFSWHAQELSEANGLALMIPRGCAHGFQTLSDDVELLYLHSHPHQPDFDSGINPLDPRVAVNWPLEFTVLSERDKNLPTISDTFHGVSP